MEDTSLRAWREEYMTGGLDHEDLLAGPLAQLGRWLGEARRAGLHEANAMVLATATPDGAPSARLVLLKGLDEDGLVFYTNYDSRKGRELADNPRCSLLFPWHPLQRQVRVEGTARVLAPQRSDAYFAARPRGAQVGAWASPQSAVVDSRTALDQAYAEAAARWPAPQPVRRPDHWGGFVVEPAVVEFWQGRADRMHDRLRYRRTDDGWAVERLAP